MTAGATGTRGSMLGARRDALADDFRRSVRGEVRFDAGSRALYATDAGNYRALPIGVVLPADAEDLVETVATCRRHGAPITARGGGTSLAGQAANATVIVDVSRHLDRIIAIDPVARTATVEPGVVLDDLRAAAAPHGLTFGPDPATHDRCTIGGMLGNDSCGVHSILAGRTSDNVEALDVLTYDGARMRVGRTSDEELAARIAGGGREGAIYAGLRDLRDRYGDLVRERFPKIPRLVSGYALDRLLPERGFDIAAALVGTEGTCVTVLRATLRLVPNPAWRVLALLGYADVFVAADAVPLVLSTGPIGLEGFDGRFVEGSRRKHLNVAGLDLLPEGGGWLMAEFGGDTLDEARDRARAALDELNRYGPVPAVRVLEEPRDQARAWAVRESALGVAAVVPGQPRAWPGWEDSAVHPDRLAGYLRDLDALLERHGLARKFYGHFGHGCVHMRVDFDFTSDAGRAAFRRFVEEAADLVVRHGGSMSGEHGDGRARSELLGRMYGAELVGAFGEFRRIWDPDGKMNPGMIVEPFRIDDDLRIAAPARPLQVATHFAFPDDGGSVALAAERCVGVGLCRRDEGGVMCPSWMATHEEQHSTRGRAHLLWEMLHGAELNGWRDRSVREALDLCLACKGCASDCPVNVDMSTLKAEFMSHYYARRVRPRAAYTMGLIHWWARLASHAPRVANAAAGAPLLGSIAKAVAGIDADRRIPRFAPMTFRRQWRRDHEPAADGGRSAAAAAGRDSGAAADPRPEVLLWPDTFNDHFHPEVAQAAVEVLEAAGYRVAIPDRVLCCGRPLYDWGMLDLAKRVLGDTLRGLRPYLDAGTPIVGLEPSCISVFRDEAVKLFPGREDARRLARQSMLLDEFLATAQGFRPGHLGATALVQGHCHHQSVLGMDGLRAVLARAGVDAEVLNAGCCGMAGAFGFERGEHRRLAQRVGERALLPAVRAAAEDTLVVTDGFSCREQVEQETGRRSLHTAELLAMTLRAGRPAADQDGSSTAV